MNIFQDNRYNLIESINNMEYEKINNQNTQLEKLLIKTNYIDEINNDNENKDIENINNENKELKKFNNNLFIIHIFNPTIYFLNEHVQYAKNHNRRLLITNIGKYSVTKPIQGKCIKSIMIDFFKNKKLNTKYCTIIDAFAGIGGDTIYFSKYYNQIHSIEKNNIHFEVLSNNVNVLDLENVKLYNGNFMDIIKKNNLIDSKYILYMDPPWGGPEYKKHKYIDLEIELDLPNEKKLHEVINILYNHYNIIFLKAPINIQINKNNFHFKNIFFKPDLENKILIIIFSKI